MEKGKEAVNKKVCRVCESTLLPVVNTTGSAKGRQNAGREGGIGTCTCLSAPALFPPFPLCSFPPNQRRNSTMTKTRLSILCLPSNQLLEGGIARHIQAGRPPPVLLFPSFFSPVPPLFHRLSSGTTQPCANTVERGGGQTSYTLCIHIEGARHEENTEDELLQTNKTALSPARCRFLPLLPLFRRARSLDESTAVVKTKRKDKID